MMNDDLVKRLRDEGIAELDEAADLIEKLEAALREIDIACDYSGAKYVCRDIAREALERKDD